MNEGNGDLQKIYEEIIKITGSINRIEGRLDGYVTHEKHAMDAIDRDRRLGDSVAQRSESAHKRIDMLEGALSEKARTIIRAELPEQIDLKNARDSRTVKQAQMLGFTGAGAGLGGILLWAVQSFWG